MQRIKITKRIRKSFALFSVFSSVLRWTATVNAPSTATYAGGRLPKAKCEDLTE